MPNDPYLDASVVWRLKSGALEFQEAGYSTTVESILSSGLATDVIGLISAGKEADVYMAAYNGAPVAIKAYRLYRTSHKGGRPVKLDSMGWLAAREYEMTMQAWRGGAKVPAPARRVENMLSMRFLGDEAGPAPRLQDVHLEEPESFRDAVLEGVEALANAGVVHTDLSAFNILVHEGEPWFIDLSEALRIDRTGDSAWERLTEAKAALESGMFSLAKYFKRYGLTLESEALVNDIIERADRFSVLKGQ